MHDVNPQDPSEARYEPGNLVSPGFFATMQLPLLAGRDFTWAERALGRQRVVIVNASFVKKFFPSGRNPALLSGNLRLAVLYGWRAHL